MTAAVRAALMLSAAALAGCSGGKGKDGAAQAPAPPDQVIGQFSVDNFVRGAREWTLESPQAYVYDPENRVEVDAPRIRFYEKGRPGARMEAGRGRFFTDKRDFHAWDGVVMVSTDGARVESPSMLFDAAKDVVSSSEAVTVTRGASVLRGVGWEAKPDLSRVVIHRQTVEYVDPRR